MFPIFKSIHSSSIITNSLYIFISLQWLSIFQSVRCMTHVILWVYQRYGQPHPYKNQPQHRYVKALPKDVGGEQLLRTGCPVVYDRKTGHRILEEGRSYVPLVELLYAPHSNLYIQKFFTCLSHIVAIIQPYIATLSCYIFYECWYSRYFINQSVKSYRVNMDHFVIPSGGYKNFQQWFTRKAKPEGRPIAEAENDDVIVSPVDCRGLFYHSFAALEEICIKGERFSLSKLLGDNELARDWCSTDCEFALLRLNPGDYHRYHTPISCTIKRCRWYGNKVHNAQGVGSLLGIELLHENERCVVECYNESIGDFLLISIGASFVSSCRVHPDITGKTLRKGEEFGNFAYGGSSFIVMFRPGTVEWDKDLMENSSLNVETKILQGEAIGTRVPEANRNRVRQQHTQEAKQFHIQPI